MKINGYRRLTYLQSSGTQYIDTQIRTINNMRIISNILLTSNGNDTYFFGSQDSQGRCCFNTGSLNGNFRYQLGENIGNTSTPISVNKKYFIDLQAKSGNSYLKVDNNTLVSFENSFDTYGTSCVFVFAIDIGSGAYGKISGRIYDLKLYLNDILVRDFIPVERESDNVLGLYDLVNNVFYTNAGSGTFIKGDYVLETHINPEGKGTITDEYEGYENSHRLTAIKKATTKFQNWLVNGYTQLDYIESSGTQYIDTLYQSNNTSRFVCEYKLNEVINTNYSNCIFGNTFNINDGYGSTYSLTFNNTSYLHSGYGQSNVNVTNDAISKDIVNSHIVDFNRNILKIDGTTITTHTSTTFNSNKNIYIFKSYSTSSSVQGWAKINIYNFKIYDNDILIRDFIPVIRHIDGQIGLLDLVHFKFYENKGTGVFQGGSVVEV